jgi:hypothetical protein
VAVTVMGLAAVAVGAAAALEDGTAAAVSGEGRSARQAATAPARYNSAGSRRCGDIVPLFCEGAERERTADKMGA